MISRDERQKLGIQRWIDFKCRATLVWPPGTGKTIAALIAIKTFLSKNPKKKVVVIVPTEILKIQWMQELNKVGLIYDVSVEIINSAINKSEKIDLLIIDEVHRTPATTFFTVFDQRRPTLILGLSATFSRLDGRHELLKQYCPVCDIITVKEAIANKWLSPYREYKVMIDVDDIMIYNNLNLQFNDAFSFFNFNFNDAMTCMTNIIFRRTYGKKMGVDAKTVDAITFSWGRALKARKEFIVNHPKKLEIARQILSARPTSKAITFSATIKQAEKIGNGYLVNSSKTKKKNRVSIEEFSKLDVGVLHTVKSVDEGVDIPGLNLAVVLCNFSSNTQKSQRIGRINRFEDGKTGEVFTLVIKGTIEENWFNNSSIGRSFIEIGEEELDDVLLLGKSDNIVQEVKQTNLLFRF